MADNEGFKIETSDELDLDWNYDLIDALNQASAFAEEASGEPAIMVMLRERGALSSKSIKAIIVEVDGGDDDKSATIIVEIA